MESERSSPTHTNSEIVTHNFRFASEISEDKYANLAPISRGEYIVKDESKNVAALEDQGNQMIKRVTEYGKMIVTKVETEVLNCNGEIVEIIREELDESSLLYRRTVQFPGLDKEPKEEVEVQAQSVKPIPETKTKTLKVPYSELNHISVDEMARRHIVEDCREFRNEYPYET